MPDRRGLLRTLFIASLAVLGAAAPVRAACPAGLPVDPAFHLPVEKLAPVASQLADHIAKKTIQSRAKDVETRPLADVQLDPKVKYNFRVYTPLSAIPPSVQNAFVAAGELATRAELEDLRRRQVFCPEVEELKFQLEILKDLATRPPGSIARNPEGFVSISAVNAIRNLSHELLSGGDRDAVFKMDGKRKGNERIIAYLVIRSNKVTVDQLLELTLNMPYFGRGSYGITAASMNYFGKPVERLSLAEAAYLAILLKGPNNYHPVRKADKAVERRNWVINQMQAKGFIIAADAKSAKAEPLIAKVE
jgi:membrane peptidoglycan carboxypeptidase